MANILITGANGFIGKSFINLYNEKFDKTIAIVRNLSDVLNEAKNINYKKGELTDKTFLLKTSQNVKAIVHTAYDNSNLQKNIKIIKTLLDVCNINKIKCFIHLSTISVYNPFLLGELNETSPYSQLYDPYSATKITIEKLINRGSILNTFTKFIVLQPAIVYGKGGNWTKHAIKELKTEKLLLPDGGKAFCNAVSVDDVCQSMYNAYTNYKYITTNSKFLISSNKPISWEYFYQLHAEKEQTISLKISNLDNNNTFHNNSIKNLIYKLVFSRIGYFLLKLIYPFLNKVVDKINYNDIFIPIGINRIVHNSQFKVNIQKAKKELGFFPQSHQKVSR